MRKVITRTNVDLDRWRHLASSDRKELMPETYDCGILCIVVKLIIEIGLERFLTSDECDVITSQRSLDYNG